MNREQMQQTLIDAAQQMRARAYAPYSNYTVGAALLTEDGGIVTGCNVENASYGLSICAERNAIGAMVAQGATQVMAIAVATENGASPCGACRQVITEFADDVPVYLVDSDNNVTELSAHGLLPHHFGPSELPPHA